MTPRPIPVRAALAAALALGGSLAATGCNIDISRVRVNVPLDREAYRRLEVDRSTLGEALSALGAPDKLEHRGNLDYLWYLHQDTISAGIRFQSPISFFGYRHTFARLEVDADDTSSMRLVFEPNGVLQQKSLRLAPGPAEPPSQGGWKFYLMPTYGWTPLMLGDGGEAKYRDLFTQGETFGARLGALPAPYFMLFLGGSYSLFPGDSFSSGGSRIGMEDLQLYQVEIGGRFQVPPRFFVEMWDVDKLKALFYSEDNSRHRGTFVFFQWAVGGVFNEEVGVTIDRAPAGSYFEDAFGLSNTLGVGAEYRWPRMGIQVSVDYQNLDEFESGGAPLDTSGGTFNTFTVSAGLSFRF